MNILGLLSKIGVNPTFTDSNTGNVLFTDQYANNDLLKIDWTATDTKIRNENNDKDVLKVGRSANNQYIQQNEKDIIKLYHDTNLFKLLGYNGTADVEFFKAESTAASIILSILGNEKFEIETDEDYIIVNLQGTKVFQACFGEHTQSGNPDTVSFPVAFSAAPIVTTAFTGNSNDASIGVPSASTTSFSSYANNTWTFNWIALGI